MKKQIKYRDKEWIVELQGILKNSRLKFSTYKLITAKNPITAYMAHRKATRKWVGTDEYLRPIKDTVEKLKIVRVSPKKR